MSGRHIRRPDSHGSVGLRLAVGLVASLAGLALLLFAGLQPWWGLAAMLVGLTFVFEALISLSLRPRKQKAAGH